jgi:hypothetical protein
MAESLEWSAFKPGERIKQIAHATAEGKTVNCGWIPPDERTREQSAINDRIVSGMPRFHIRGHFTAAERRYPLWRAGKTLLGKFLPYVWQQTGSCVGAGGGNMQMTGMSVEIVLHSEVEEFKVPWWLFAYGRSRYRGGMNGQGEGSFGSAWAEAITKDGSFEIDPEGAPDLPDYKVQDGWIVQPAKTEMQWSDGGRVQDVWLKLGVKHLFRTAAVMKSAQDCAEALMNGYALTLASNFGIRPMVPSPTGDPAVRLATWNGSWAHQMFSDEYWDHPSLGEIFRIGNNWGPDAHGSPTGEEPPGGFYIRAKTMDQICRNGEVYAFSGFDGFPARSLDFGAF